MSDDENADNHPAAALGGRLRIPAPLFAGEGTAEAVATEAQIFIADFDSYCAITNVGDDNKLAAVRACFKKGTEASRWFHMVSQGGEGPDKAVGTWADVKVLFLKRFDTPKTSLQLAASISELVQKPDERVQTFADRVRAVQVDVDKKRKEATIAGVTAAHKTRCIGVFSNLDAQLRFITGLRPDLRQVISQQDIPDLFDNLLEAAIRAEAAVLESKVKQPAAAVAALNTGGNRGSGNQGGQGGRNQSQGHPNDRPKWVILKDLPPGTCYVCGRTGHSRRDCRARPENYAWKQVISQLGLRPDPARLQALKQQGRNKGQPRQMSAAGLPQQEQLPPQQQQLPQPPLPQPQQQMQQFPVVPQPLGQQPPIVYVQQPGLQQPGLSGLGASASGYGGGTGGSSGGGDGSFEDFF